MEIPGNPPAAGELPAPLPLPRAAPVPAPVPVPAAVPRPVPVPSAVGFTPVPLAEPYLAPLPVPDPPEPKAPPPPEAASAMASPLALSDGAPLPEAFEENPPPLVPAAGSAITVVSAGATAKSERDSPSGTLAIISGGGGIAFSTKSPCLPRALRGTSEVRAGAGTGSGGGACGIDGSAAANSGMLLVAAAGSLSLGACTAFSSGRIASLPDSTFITGFGGSGAGGAGAIARLGSGKAFCSIIGFLRLGCRIV